ncbi:MAG TPA: Holliday junction branch migration protein RuvA [Firmicutes bacterium]|nr:Holliday junction branch migration protein RuvA [Bacillota bacterium]
MYYYLKGILKAKEPEYVILEVGGIGYQISVPPSLAPALPPPGEELLLYTYFYMREDGVSLYGFLTPESRRIFSLALGVRGIGPRVALNITGSMSPLEFTQAVLAEDHALLTKVPGIGPKTAQRLTLELKEKLRELAPELTGRETAPGIAGSTWQEAIGALVVLGYTLDEARPAVEAVAEAGDDLEELVKKALRYLGEK